MALDLYQRLGLKRGASEAEIKKAYRSLAKQLHPDRNKDNPQAAQRFSEVTRAYDLLMNCDSPRKAACPQRFPKLGEESGGR